MFFLDRSLGRHAIANALRQAGAHVEIHDDHFATDVPDTVWLTHAGQQGWVVCTKDDRIRYRAQERAALLAAGVRAFILVARNLAGPEMAASFVQALPAMHRVLTKHPPPFLARVTREGNVSLMDY